MRRIALLGLALCLSGCGYKTWWNPPFTGGYNPNLPSDNSENTQRALGHLTDATPINPEPGDIWPGPLPPAPTLGDLESQGGSAPQAPTKGSPLSRGEAPVYPPQNLSQGSSSPPSGNQAVMPPIQTAPPLSSYAAPAAPPPAPEAGGKVIQTVPGGPAVTTGGGPGYSTAIQPGGGQSIVVPNGNGTSTVIHADGRIETVPTPK
jgi:hypothetical protein